MDYAKYDIYKSKGMVVIDATGATPIFTLSKYNPDTGDLEVVDSAEITKTILDERRAIINAQISSLEKELNNLDALENDIKKI